MRVFIALILPPSLKSDLLAATASLRKAYPTFRWQRPDQLHLSLAFLGELDSAQVTAAANCLERAIDATITQPLSLSIDGLVYFPPRGALRIVAAGIAEPAASLCRRLAEALESELEKSGQQAGPSFRPADKRPFKAHITLARVKNSHQRPADKLLDRPLQTEITAAGLFSSTLRPAGAIYKLEIEAVFPGVQPDLVSGVGR